MLPFYWISVQASKYSGILVRHCDYWLQNFSVFACFLEYLLDLPCHTSLSFLNHISLGFFFNIRIRDFNKNSVNFGKSICYTFIAWTSTILGRKAWSPLLETFMVGTRHSATSIYPFCKASPSSLKDWTRWRAKRGEWTTLGRPSDVSTTSVGWRALFRVCQRTSFILGRY